MAERLELRCASTDACAGVYRLEEAHRLPAQQVLGQLEFVPQDQFRLQRCMDTVSTLSPAVAERLEAVLAASGHALSAMRHAGPLRVLAAFAGSLPQCVSQHTFQTLNRLQSAAA